MRCAANTAAALARLRFRPDAARGGAESFGRWITHNPITSTIVVASVRGGLGDYGAQRVEHVTRQQQQQQQQGGDSFELDWRRWFLYSSFTNLIAFMYDRPLYTLLLPRLFPTFVLGRRVWSNVIQATVLDCAIITPLWYLPIF